MKNSLQ